MAKNSNPYNNIKFSNEPKILKKSANKASMVGKPMKKLKADRKGGKDRSIPQQSHSRYQIAVKKNSARMSEELGTHRERQSIDDYSKVLNKLKKMGANKGKALRNIVNNIETDSKFMKNQESVLYSRKSQ